MIRGNLFIPLFLIFFCLYGCNSRHTDERILNKKVLSEAKVLSLDTIDLKGIERSLAYQYYVYKDSVLIVQNITSGGLVIACQNNKKIMYASMHQSTIELYNNMLEMEKAIIGPKELDTDYYIDENNEVIFDRSIPYTYINYYCTSKEVGLLYYGTLVNAPNDEFENHNGYLLVFDWEGNLKKNYAIGAHALAVSKSVKYPNTYYCCIRGKDKELYLCKAHE